MLLLPPHRAKSGGPRVGAPFAFGHFSRSTQPGLVPLPGLSLLARRDSRWVRSLPRGRAQRRSRLACAALLSADLRQGTGHLLGTKTAGLYRSKDA